MLVASNYLTRYVKYLLYGQLLPPVESFCTATVSYIGDLLVANNVAGNHASFLDSMWDELFNN